MSVCVFRYHDVKVGHDTFTVDVRYSKLKRIGNGSYGLVVSAFDSVTNRQVAIKKISNTFDDLIDAKRILREIKLLRHFNSHENVITIQDMILMPPETVDFSDVYIITNLMESDLDRIISSSQDLTDQHFQYFLYQILRGLKYVHSADVLHRDLKPGNLLVNANCDLALCDFGLSRGVDGSEHDITTYVVTRWYRAPELLCDSSTYGKAVDIWSVGCIFAEMICRKPFFQGKNPMNQLQVSDGREWLRTNARRGMAGQKRVAKNKRVVTGALHETSCTKRAARNALHKTRYTKRAARNALHDRCHCLSLLRRAGHQRMPIQRRRSKDAAPCSHMCMTRRLTSSGPSVGTIGVCVGPFLTLAAGHRGEAGIAQS